MAASISEHHPGAVPPAAVSLPGGPAMLRIAPPEGLALHLADLWEYRELLLFLTWRDVKVRYKQTAMGATWAIIQPLFIVLTFAVFFGLLVGIPTENLPFLVFYYCGLLPWTFFANAVTQSSMSLVGS